MKWNYKIATLLTICLSAILRICIAGSLEFGNDEVYYWLYAKYPDVSHFDHPPMVGFFIQLFTFNLSFDSELVIRLAAIVPSAISMYVVFLIAKFLRDEKTGFTAVLLYVLSIYGFIISGTFILPDAPMVLFWLVSFYIFIKVIPFKPNKNLVKKLLLGFFFAACAVYSKYQAVFLLLGVFFYVLFFNRSWLKNVFFYAGFLFPLGAIFLILYWNYNNDFISYKFHGDRVSLFSLKFNKVSFLREILGQVLYNNPYTVVVLVLALISYFKGRFRPDKKLARLFFCCAFPLIITSIYLSLYRDTLPHWSGVSHLTLLPIVALYVNKANKIERKLIVGCLSFSFLLFLAIPVINRGWFMPKQVSKNETTQGKKDVLLDMYGWKQASKKLTKTFEKHKLKELPILSNKWYPAAHIDYYIARPNNMLVNGVGELRDIHKYYWINKENNNDLSKVLFITDSRNYKDPNQYFKESYSKIELLQVVPIYRGDDLVKNVFLYVLQF